MSCSSSNLFLDFVSHKYQLEISEIELVHLEIVGNSLQIFSHTIIGISLNHAQNPLIAHSIM